MTDSTMALMRAGTNAGKLADTVRNMWEERTKLRADGSGQAWDLTLRAQVDEIFLVLAHMGEAILPLGVFNKDYYLHTLGDVKASLASCGNEMLVMAWEELDAELQYCCCAGFTFCAHFSPMPVYRGFGACVLSDWDWGCPDLAYLEEKARKKAIRTVYGVKQKTDPQPTRSVFQDFDQAIQILQVKPMAFFVKRPPVSGFTDRPRFEPRLKKEVKSDLELLEDWLHQISRREHPAPAGHRITNWGVPFATWTSESNYYILKSEKDSETLMLNQMDPGRLLHAFVCRRAASLDEYSMFSLMPRSAAESIMSWLEGLPGMNHMVIKWDDLETKAFEKKLSKSLRKRLGHYPIPVKYAVRHPNAATRPELHVSESSPAVLEHPHTVPPPLYSAQNAHNESSSPGLHKRPERAATVPVAELPVPETQELPAETAESPTQPSQTVARDRTSKLGLKSIHTLRRKPSDNSAAAASATVVATATTRHPSVLRPGALKGRTSTNWMIEDAAEPNVHETKAEEPAAVELPAEVAASHKASRKPVPSVVVQPLDDSAELPVVTSPEKIEAAVAAADANPPDVRTSEPRALNQSASETSVDATPPPPPATDNNYLELLNKVARGEISPQTLSEMLQSGSLSQSPIPTKPDRETSTATAGPATSADAGKSERAPAPTPCPLPYPE